MAYANFSQNNVKTNVQFFSGLQENLTSKIVNGGAIEGAFYLTTDTQRLYVGRKDTTDDKIYAVQVSRGVTFVATSGDLPAASAADIEEGELYYITTTNVLAALREKLQDNGSSYSPKQYEWVQINPPTGISKIDGNAVVSGTKDVIVNSVVSTAAGNKTGKTKFVAGSNVTLTAGGNETIDGVQAAKITIAATDTTYTVGTEATTVPQGQTIGNDAILELRTNGEDNNASNTKVHITGENTVAVTSDANGNISVKGPTLSNVTVGARAAAANGGFLIGLSGTDGQNNSLNVTAGELNPIIKYGQSGTAHDTGVKFNSGVATLDIYTKDETDTAIEEAINDKLSTANAMTYCGTVSNETGKTFVEVLREKVIANGGARNGDVYKVTGVDTTYNIDGKVIDVGDLLIINGTEETSGTFAGQIKVGNTGVTGSGTIADPYTATSAYTANGILDLCDLVPAGDEPEVQALVIASTSNSTATTIQLRDGKNGANTNILTTTFQGEGKSGAASKIEVTSAEESVTGKKINVKIAHATTSRTDATNGDKNNVALAQNTTTGTDTLGGDQYTFYVLKNGSADLKTDVYGHVTGLQTSPVTISHNKITKLKTTYGINANSGLIYIDREDSIGSTGLTDANKAQIKLTSSTLSLVGSTTGLSVDLVWQTF